MISVSHGAGLHSQESDADDFWSLDMDKQWRKPRIQFLKGGVAQMQRAFRYPPGSIAPTTASNTSTSVPQCAKCAAVRSGSPCDAEDGNSSQESQTRGAPCHSTRAAMSAPRRRADMAQRRPRPVDDPMRKSPLLQHSCEIQEICSDIDKSIDTRFSALRPNRSSRATRANAAIQLSLDCVGNGTTPDFLVEARRSNRSS
jgi:hypothetical protein